MNAFTEWCNKYFFWIDALLSLGLVVLLFIISEKYWDITGKCIDLIKSEQECLLSLVITIAATAIGFVLTGLTVLLTLCDAGKFGILVKNKHFHLIFKTYLHSVYVLACVVVISAIWLFLKDTNGIDIWMFYLLVSSSILTLFRLVRCVWIMRILIYVILSLVKK